jgi:hypothetical protein
VVYNSDDDEDDMDIQIIEPIPMDELDNDQKEGLRVLAQRGTTIVHITLHNLIFALLLVYFAHTVLGFYEERDATEDKKE